MTHGDNNGLVLPPKIAPTQVMVIPINMKKAGVLEKAQEIAEALKSAGIRTGCDTSDQSPGWKFSEYEMRGIPLRIEIGPRDIENNQCVAVSRDNREKGHRLARRARLLRKRAARRRSEAPLREG